MTPQEAAREIERRKKALVKELLRAQNQTLKDGLTYAKAASQGPYKQKQLDAMGPPGPYSKRRPHPPADPAIINKQTGRLWRSWKMDSAFLWGGSILGRFYNTSPEAEDFDEDEARHHNKFMMPRPIQKLLREAILRPRRQHLRDAVKKALKL